MKTIFVQKWLDELFPGADLKITISIHKYKHDLDNYVTKHSCSHSTKYCKAVEVQIGDEIWSNVFKSTQNPHWIDQKYAPDWVRQYFVTE